MDKPKSWLAYVLHIEDPMHGNMPGKPTQLNHIYPFIPGEEIPTRVIAEMAMSKRCVAYVAEINPLEMLEQPKRKDADADR